MFLYKQFTGGTNNSICVALDKQAEVLLLDTCNYNRFKSGKSYRGMGFIPKVSPYTFSPPHHGSWHVVVKPIGARVKASIQIN